MITLTPRRRLRSARFRGDRHAASNGRAGAPVGPARLVGAGSAARYELRYRATRRHPGPRPSVGVTMDLCRDGTAEGAVEALLDEHDLDALSTTSGVTERGPNGPTRAL